MEAPIASSHTNPPFGSPEENAAWDNTSGKLAAGDLEPPLGNDVKPSQDREQSPQRAISSNLASELKDQASLWVDRNTDKALGVVGFFAAITVMGYFLLTPKAEESSPMKVDANPK